MIKYAPAGLFIKISFMGEGGLFRRGTDSGLGAY